MTTTTYTPAELKSFRIRADITIGAAALGLSRFIGWDISATELSQFENERLDKPWPAWMHQAYIDWLRGEGAI